MQSPPIHLPPQREVLRAVLSPYAILIPYQPSDSSRCFNLDVRALSMLLEGGLKDGRVLSGVRCEVVALTTPAVRPAAPQDALGHELFELFRGTSRVGLAQGPFGLFELG